MTTTYGTLTYHPLKQQPPVWSVQAQPHVMIRVKRVLPRVQQHRSGRVLVSDTLDVARDLQWLHERYPLEMNPLTAEVLAERLGRWTQRQQAIDDILSGHPGGALLMEPARPPRDYQLQFASMFRAVRRLVLADDVGLGKTLSGLLILAEPDALPALVVTLTHLPQQWLGELAKTWPGLLGHAVTRGTPYDLQAACKGRYPDVVVMNYHKLRGWAHALTGEVKTVLFDEGQELRHGTSTDKGCAAAQVTADANYAAVLSATPVYNRGGEIWNIVDILDKGRLGSREEFLREWGGGTENNGQITVEDPQALGTYLRSSGLLLRRTRKDVHRELPEPIRIRQEVDADPAKIDELAGDALQMAQLVLSTSAKQQDRWTAAGDLDLKLRQATGVAKAPYVAEFVRLLLESEQRVVLFGWHRACFEAGTRVLMYDGTSRAVEDVCEGEQVMGPDSKPRTVKRLVRGHGQMYRITPSKGRAWVCSANHILTVWNSWARRYETWTAQEFAGRSKRWQRDRLIYRAPEVHFEHGTLVAEPWLLGYWLGDGASNLGDVRVLSADAEVEEELQAIARRHGLYVRSHPAPGVTGISKCKHLCLTLGSGERRAGRYRNPLTQYFRSLGLRNNKHIPHSYKTAPVADRWELLAGLIDSDGHVYRGNGVGTAEYTTTLERLAADVAFLARSLGLAAYVKVDAQARSGYGKTHKAQFVVTISGDLMPLPTRIARKRPQSRAGQKDVLRTGFTIQESNADDFYGFEVDGDHLFLLEDFTVVHNCYAIWMDKLRQFRPVLYTGTESPTQKNASAQEFIHGESRVLMMSLRAGAGLDGLQESCSVAVFGELDWSPGIHDQCVGRLARDGQESTVAAYFMVSNHGSDPPMDEVLQLKRMQAEPIRDPDAPLLAPIPASVDRVRLLAQSVLDRATGKGVKTG